MGSGSSAGCSPAKRHRWEEVENPVSSDFDLKARQATKGCLWLVGSVTTSFALQGASEGKIEAIEKLTARRLTGRSEEHTSELQSLMRISYAVFGLKKKKHTNHEQ